GDTSSRRDWRSDVCSADLVSRQAVLAIDDVRGRSRRHRERRRGWGWGFGPCLGRRVAGLAVVQGAVFVGVGEGGDRFGARDDAAVGAVRLAVFVAHHEARAEEHTLELQYHRDIVYGAVVADKHAFDRGAGVVGGPRCHVNLFVYYFGIALVLHSFPTRRSSDLCLGRRVAGLAVVQGAVFVGVGEGGDRFGARDDAAVGAVRLAVFVAHHEA